MHQYLLIVNFQTEDEFDQLVSQFVNVLKARFPDEALSNGSPPNGTMITADGYCSSSRVSRTLLIEWAEVYITTNALANPPTCL